MPNSPLPSISGAVYSNLNTQTNDTRMASVNEEEDDKTKSMLSNVAEKSALEDKLKDPRSCNERSDSGFSECSNCSTPSASCVCNLSLLDKKQSILEEHSSNSSSSNEPDETTESAGAEKTAAEESISVSSEHDARSEVSSLEYDDSNKSTCDDSRNIVMTIRIPSKRELLQNNSKDLLSEVERRKSSLENMKKKTSSLKNEVCLEKLKKNNKVALLLEKFESSSPPCRKIKPAVTKIEPFSKGLSTNPVRATAFESVQSLNVSRTYNNEVDLNFTTDSHFAVQPNSPTRNSTNPTTFRLSNRVREVTERLSRPKQHTTIDPDIWKR